MQPCSKLPYYGLDLSPSQAVPFCIREDTHTRTHTHTYLETDAHTALAMSILLLLFYLSSSAFGGVFSACIIFVFSCVHLDGYLNSDSTDSLSEFVLCSASSHFLSHTHTYTLFVSLCLFSFSLNPGSHHYIESLMKSLSDFTRLKQHN